MSRAVSSCVSSSSARKRATASISRVMTPAASSNETSAVDTVFDNPASIHIVRRPLSGLVESIPSRFSTASVTGTASNRFFGISFSTSDSPKMLTRNALSGSEKSSQNRILGSISPKSLASSWRSRAVRSSSGACFPAMRETSCRPSSTSTRSSPVIVSTTSEIPPLF